MSLTAGTRSRTARALPSGAHASDGFAATELVLGIGLLLVPVALVVLTLPTWSERQTTARAVAREVARMVASSGVCDVGRAQRLGAVMSENLGLHNRDVGVAIACDPGASLEPGSEVEARVTVRMPAVHLFGVGDVGEWSWTAHHRQPVDLYIGVR